MVKIKCPLCENYFIAGVTKFEKLRVSYKSSWKPDDYIRVCPKCFEDNAGVLIK